MKQITRQELLQFLKIEGYEINSKNCDEETLKHSDCWTKQGRNKAIVSKSKKIFQYSELQNIFLDIIILTKAKSYFK